jgi:hypothetical protein
MDKAFKSIGLASFDSPEITARLVVPPSVLRVISRVILALFLRYFCVILALVSRHQPWSLPLTISLRAAADPQVGLRQFAATVPA